MTPITKPTIQAVPLSIGLNWTGDNGYLFQEKSDGQHEFASLPGAVVNAERMAGGELIVNDILSRDGQDVRQASTVTRWGILLDWAVSQRGEYQLCQFELGNGGEFLKYIMRGNGEGIVAKPLDAPFGAGWLKCKRREVFQCRVVGMCPLLGTVQLADGATMQPRGKIALRGGKFEQVRIGSILKVEAFGAHASGLLREARPDQDSLTSWLVRF